MFIKWRKLKKELRKVDFLILLLVGIGFSYWAFIEKDFFGSIVLLLSFIVFATTRWKWVYKNGNISTKKERLQAREWFKKMSLCHLKWRTYLFVYFLTIPIFLMVSRYFDLNFRDDFIVFV